MLGRRFSGGGPGRYGRGFWRRLVGLFVARLQPFEFLDCVDDLGDIEERVALQADVNERGLHAGEDLRDPPLVDIANDTARLLALDEDLDDLIVLENGDPCVVVARGDDHLLVHGNNSGERAALAGRAAPIARGRRVGPKAGPTPDREHEEQDGHRDALELCEEPLNRTSPHG